jgi:hypothetical protein
MDLTLYGRVLWRFRFIVLAGFALAIVLAGLDMFKVTPHGLKYRKAEIWSSNATLLLTQRDFPIGWSTPPYTVTAGTNSLIPKFADTSRFASLALIFAQLANSDAVQRLLTEQGGAPGAISARARVVGDASNAPPLPIIDFSGIATSPRDAYVTAAKGVAAFKSYVSQREDAAGVPANQRVEIQVLNAPAGAALTQPRKKTLPIVIFLTVAMITLALAFVLENLRPRVRLVGSQPGEAAAPETVPSRLRA